MSDNIIRFLYRTAVGAATLAALPLRARDKRLGVFYGGARAGDFGGTLVKVRLLQSRFPERWLGFSLAYILSNAVYVPQPVLNAMQSAGVPVVLNQNGVFYPGWYPKGWEQENSRMAEGPCVGGLCILSERVLPSLRGKISRPAQWKL